MNMLLQLLRLRQACNHPWLVKGAPGIPDAFSSSVGVTSGTSGGAQAGGARGATAAEVSAVRRLAPDSQAALLQVRDALCVCACLYGRQLARLYCCCSWMSYVDCHGLNLSLGALESLHACRIQFDLLHVDGVLRAQLSVCAVAYATVCAGSAGLQQHVWLMWGCTRGSQYHTLLPHLL